MGGTLQGLDLDSMDTGRMGRLLSMLMDAYEERADTGVPRQAYMLRDVHSMKSMLYDRDRDSILCGKSFLRLLGGNLGDAEEACSCMDSVDGKLLADMRLSVLMCIRMLWYLDRWERSGRSDGASEAMARSCALALQSVACPAFAVAGVGLQAVPAGERMENVEKERGKETGDERAWEGRGPYARDGVEGPAVV